MASIHNENNLRYARLLELLFYNPDTGEFIYNVARGPHKAGDLAGSLSDSGHIHLRIDRIAFLAHRVAWFYCFQEWPENVIDHTDRNPSNNRLDNLRDVTQTKNMHNMGIASHNTSGYKGVSFNKQKNKFEAYISVNSRKKNLGLYNTAEEANNAYLEAVKEYRE